MKQKKIKTVVITGLLFGVLATVLSWLAAVLLQIITNDRFLIGVAGVVQDVVNGVVVLLCFLVAEWVSLRNNFREQLDTQLSIWHCLMLTVGAFIVGYALAAGIAFPAYR